MELPQLVFFLKMGRDTHQSQPNLWTSAPQCWFGFQFQLFLGFIFLLIQSRLEETLPA